VRWPIGRPFALAPRMQAITLDVIMGGIFGIEGRPRRGVEYALRKAIRELLRGSTMPGAKLAEWMNLGHDEPFGLTWIGLQIPDRCVYAIIRKRRREADLEQRTDIMSLIMRARAEDGEALTDQELEPGVFSIAAAVRDRTDQVIAAINVTGPIERFAEQQVTVRYIPAVVRTAGELSVALGAVSRATVEAGPSSRYRRSARASRR